MVSAHGGRVLFRSSPDSFSEVIEVYLYIDGPLLSGDYAQAYYQGQIEVAQFACDVPGVEDCILRLIVHDFINPTYDAAAKRLLGKRLYSMFMLHRPGGKEPDYDGYKMKMREIEVMFAQLVERTILV